MGGSAEHPLYKWFCALVVRGFLAVRQRMDTVLALTQAMLLSSLGCFRLGRTGGQWAPALLRTRARFFPDRDEQVRTRAGILSILSSAAQQSTAHRNTAQDSTGQRSAIAGVVQRECLF